MEAQHSPFQFTHFQVIESQLKRKQQGKELSFHLDLKPSGIIDQKRMIFELIMEVTISESKKQFSAKLVTRSEFRFSKEVNPETLDNYFFVNAPAIVFPYIRAYISTLTAISGMTPVHMPAIDLRPFAEILKENTLWD